MTFRQWLLQLTPFKTSQVRKDLALSAASYKEGRRPRGRGRGQGGGAEAKWEGEGEGEARTGRHKCIRMCNPHRRSKEVTNLPSSFMQ